MKGEPEYFSKQVSDARRWFLALPGAQGKSIVTVSTGCERCPPDYVIERSDFSFECVEFVTEGVAVATCADAVAALGAMAALVRGRSKARVVGITGSCGKTSTKEILATLLGATGEVCASRASFRVTS